MILEQTGAFIAHPDPEIFTNAGKEGSQPKQAVASESKDALARALAIKFEEIKSTKQLLQWKDQIDGEEHLMIAASLNITPKTNWYMAIAVPEAVILKEVWRGNYITLGIAVVLLFISCIIARYFAGLISQSLKPLFKDIKNIGNFELEYQGSQGSSRITEIAELGDSLENMERSLRSFRRFVPVDLVRELISEGIEAKVGGKRVEASVVFSDITGFTSIS